MNKIMYTKTGFYPAGKTENQPFPKGAGGSDKFRIPAIIKLDNGNLFAVCDARWNTKCDSGGIDTLCAVSSDMGKTWELSYSIMLPDTFESPINHYDSTVSIDPLLVQARSGRIIIISDLNPTGYTTALHYPRIGTGYVEINGTKRLAVCDEYKIADESPENGNYKYFVSDFEDGFAKIMSADGDTEYSVDEYFNIYKNNKPIYQKQVNTDEKVQQNLFYRDSELHVYNTVYMLMMYSDDYGKTWHTKIINDQIKKDTDTAFIVSPGKGTVLENGRIIAPFYDVLELYNGDERYLREGSACLCYSDDNGETWTRTDNVPATDKIIWSSESEAVELNDGTVRLFFRNDLNRVCYADANFVNGKYEWSTPVITDVLVRSGCNLSVISLGDNEDGNQMLLFSAPRGERETGNGRHHGTFYYFEVLPDKSLKFVNSELVYEFDFEYSSVEKIGDKIALIFDHNEGLIDFKFVSLKNNK